MKLPAPHFLLFSQARTDTSECGVGQWRFVLESADGAARIEAADEEPATTQRLELLAIVRGLEALDQPSRVTLVTGSRYVSRGIRFGLSQWREDGWQWERYGEMSPIKDGDLWRRVDQALQFHQVECQNPNKCDLSDDLGVPALRVAPQPMDHKTDGAQPTGTTPIRRRRRGQTLRFDAGEAPSRVRRSSRAARAPAWPMRLWNRLTSFLSRRVTASGEGAVSHRKSLFH
jgi:ribonuclease HI